MATAIHAGHDLRPDVTAAMLLSEQDRLREEDPFTDLIAAAVPDRVVTTRSRFEVDLNRPRREAVYRRPKDAWGLDLWRDGVLPEPLFRAGLAGAAPERQELSLARTASGGRAEAGHRRAHCAR